MNKIILLIYKTNHLDLVVIDFRMTVNDVRKFGTEFVWKKIIPGEKKKPISNSYNIIGIELARGKFTENFY